MPGFSWTVLALSVDGYTLDHPRFARVRSGAPLGKGLYAMLRANLDEELAPNGPGVRNGTMSWVLPRPVLVAVDPTMDTVRRWRNAVRVDPGCALLDTVDPDATPGLSGILARAKRRA